ADRGPPLPAGRVQRPPAGGRLRRRLRAEQVARRGRRTVQLRGQPRRPGQHLRVQGLHPLGPLQTRRKPLRTGGRWPAVTASPREIGTDCTDFPTHTPTNRGTRTMNPLNLPGLDADRDLWGRLCDATYERDRLAAALRRLLVATR